MSYVRSGEILALATNKFRGHAGILPNNKSGSKGTPRNQKM